MLTLSDKNLEDYLSNMESSEKSQLPNQQGQDSKWKERKEQEYKDAISAAEELYQMSLIGDVDNEKIKKLCETIGPYGPFQDRLVELRTGKLGEASIKYKIGHHFFETLPIINKMAKIYKNFTESSQARGSFFINAEVSQISNDARFVLYRGLSGVNEDTLWQLDEAKTKDFFESLKLLLTSSQDFAIEKTINFLEHNKELLQKVSGDKKLPEVKTQIEELQKFLGTRDFERVLVYAVQEGINNRRHINKRGAKIEHLEELLKKVLAKYGLDPDEILDTWNGSHTEHSPQPQIDANMSRVFDLEDKREGIAHLLYREFGIRNFERYPESILIRQFDEFDDVEKPHGVMIQATHDYNGALGSWSNTEIWEKMFDQIKDRYAFRIVEAKSKLEVARRLIGLDRKYGKNHKLSFAFIGGHGSEDTIQFGGDEKRGRLFLEDLAGRGAQRTNKFFKPHPTIVLVSCSTGAEGGIGQKLSKILGAKIIAPDVPTNLKSIEADLTNENIDFKVTYGTKDEQQDIGRVYLDGKRT